MLHHQEKLTENNSLKPNHRRCDCSPGFSFWAVQKASFLRDQSDDLNIVHENIEQVSEEVRSKPLWQAKQTDASPKSRKNSSLLPYQHVCPQKQEQVSCAEEWRKRVVEMMDQMPDMSGLELSLKDIVDNQQGAGLELGFQRNEEMNGFVLDQSEEACQMMKKQDKKGTRSGSVSSEKKLSRDSSLAMSRNGSSNSETFLIKTFFPTFVSVRRRDQKCSPSGSREFWARTSNWSTTSAEKIGKKKVDGPCISCYGGRKMDGGSMTGCGFSCYFMKSKTRKNKKGI